MYCRKCGTKNDDNAKFCISCGSELNEITANENKDKTNYSSNYSSRFNYNQPVVQIGCNTKCKKKRQAKLFLFV